MQCRSDALHLSGFEYTRTRYVARFFVKASRVVLLPRPVVFEKCGWGRGTEQEYPLMTRHSSISWLWRQNVFKKAQKKCRQNSKQMLPANCSAPKRLMTHGLYSVICIRSPPSASLIPTVSSTHQQHITLQVRTPFQYCRLNHSMEAQNQATIPQAMHSRSRSPENRSPYQPPLKRRRHPRWCDLVEQRSLANGIEENTHRVAQRQKQIDYGKNTIAYDRFNAVRPRESRKRGDPMTPLARQKCSKRSFAGQITSWKKHVYAFVAKIDAQQNANNREQHKPSVTAMDNVGAHVSGKESVGMEVKVKPENPAADMVVEKPPALPDWDEECELSDFDDIELDDYGNVVEKPQTSPSPKPPNSEPSKSDESPASIFDGF